MTLQQIPEQKYIFFTGKGGVGKTTCATLAAVRLADQGKQVLLISTDPASNLDDILEARLMSSPVQVAGINGLWAMNIDPIVAAMAYRERIIRPLRGLYNEEVITSIEEQLSGGCTIEIAAFNEFSRIIGDHAFAAKYDQIIIDTAPTGHTLRLLRLPQAWADFTVNSRSGVSCLGPMSGLSEEQSIYELAAAVLKDPKLTVVMLVARPDLESLKEANTAGRNLYDQGMVNQQLILNGLFTTDSADEVALALQQRCDEALSMMPPYLANLQRWELNYVAGELQGVDVLRRAFSPDCDEIGCVEDWVFPEAVVSWRDFVNQLLHVPTGIIMVMGKGGVGKTTIAAGIAVLGAQFGAQVTLATTDPAAHARDTLGGDNTDIEVLQIDPLLETKNYVNEVIEENRSSLTEDELDLLKEELSSPCIEEIAVFKKFSEYIAMGNDRLVVIDTAPTGHTLLLLEAADAYSKQMQGRRNYQETSDALAMLRDQRFSRIVIVTLPGTTPVSEAKSLQADLSRAGIEVFGWVVNQCFSGINTTDQQLRARSSGELRHISNVVNSHANVTKINWSPVLPVGLQNIERVFLCEEWASDSVGRAGTT